MARDPLFEALNRVSLETSQAVVDLNKLGMELKKICETLWQYRMKRIFGQTLGTGWIEHVPETWFLMNGSKGP
jgi:hypothetical protein